MAWPDFPSNGAKMYSVLYIAPGAGPHPTVLMVHGFPGMKRTLISRTPSSGLAGTCWSRSIVARGAVEASWSPQYLVISISASASDGSFFISTAESALAGIAALAPVGSAPELSHRTAEPQLS